MSNKLCLVLSVLVTASMLLAACTPAAVPTAAPTAVVQPTTAPAAAAPAAQPAGAAIKVGLITGISADSGADTGGVEDQGLNRLAWEGVQKAAAELGFPAKLLESKQPGDDEPNIDALASEGYTVILTIGAAMGEVTAVKARQYPNIRFAIIDHAYAGDGPANLTSLVFAEEQAGFLAGVLAGGMSRSGFVCSVSSLRTPASERYMISFFQGAAWQAGPELKFMNNFINIQTTDEKVPAIADPTRGKETALKLIGDGCDVVFGIGGEAVSGALLAAKESSLPAVGADIDWYSASPDVKEALLTSALKKVDVAVYTYLKAAAGGPVEAGISTGTLQNGGVGLAPFHDWDSQVPAELKAQIQKASDGIKDGSIKID